MSEEKEIKSIKVSLKRLVFISMILIVIIMGLIYISLNKLKDLDKNKVSTIQKSKENITIIEFNEEDAISLLTQYLDDRSLAYSNPQALLEKYSFATNQEFSKFEKTADEQFIRTDIIYEKIRNQMQKYITKEFFTKQFKNVYKLSNGITHVAVTKTSKESYTITRHELLETTTKQRLNVWYKTTKDGVTSEEKNMQVEYSKINGNWIISNIK